MDAKSHRGAAPDHIEWSTQLVRTALKADCEQCVGLCCVIPGFLRSSQFPVDKPACQPCPNLTVQDRCAIHEQLRPKGYSGCTVYDCFGAGQLLCKLRPGITWRQGPESLSRMARAFTDLRDVGELSWHCASALIHLAQIPPGSRPQRLVALLAAQLNRLQTSHALTGSELAAQWASASALLDQTSAAVRRDGPKHHRADLAGRDLRAKSLKDAYLRGAVLIAADLRGVDLSRADMLGADLRDADLRGSKLRESLFLTNAAVASAFGDRSTSLPAHIERPDHWA